MTVITVCTTCRNSESRATEAAPDAPRDGESFLSAVQEAAGDLKVRGVACLMGCDRGCNVAISAPDKMTYVLGKFDGTPSDAQAIVEYASKHAASDGGTVPFREWPTGVKGHFVARIPPLDEPA